MKIVTFFLTFFCVTNSISTICGYDSFFTWSCKAKKNGQDMTPERPFAHIDDLVKIISAIIEEQPAVFHWTFESKNLPNFKELKIQRTDLTDPNNEIITLVTYNLLITNTSHSTLNTSIWGFNPDLHSSNIHITALTASHLSILFNRYNTPTSNTLCPIIHCITNARFTYTPQTSIQRRPVLTQNDNRRVKRDNNNPTHKYADDSDSD